MKHEKIAREVPETMFGFAPPRFVDLDRHRAFRGPGEGTDELVMVCSGLICLYSVGGDGARAIVALRYPNEFVLPGGRAPAFGIAPIVGSTVAVGKPNYESTAAVLAIAQRHEVIAQVWAARQHMDADARVAHLLCETLVRSGQGLKDFELPFTQTQIADITAQTNVNVNRVLANLERSGLIERKGRLLSIPSWFELARLGGFDAGYLHG